jgi:hypothetical protein
LRIFAITFEYEKNDYIVPFECVYDESIGTCQTYNEIKYNMYEYKKDFLNTDDKLQNSCDKYTIPSKITNESIMKACGISISYSFGC